MSDINKLVDDMSSSTIIDKIVELMKDYNEKSGYENNFQLITTKDVADKIDDVLKNRKWSHIKDMEFDTACIISDKFPGDNKVPVIITYKYTDSKIWLVPLTSDRPYKISIQ